MWRDSPRVAAEGVTLSTPALTCSSSSRWAPLPVPSPARPPAASAKTDGAAWQRPWRRGCSGGVRTLATAALLDGRQRASSSGGASTRFRGRGGWGGREGRERGAVAVSRSCEGGSRVGARAVGGRQQVSGLGCGGGFRGEVRLPWVKLGFFTVDDSGPLPLGERAYVKKRARKSHT